MILRKQSKESKDNVYLLDLVEDNFELEADLEEDESDLVEDNFELEADSEEDKSDLVEDKFDLEADYEEDENLLVKNIRVGRKRLALEYLSFVLNVQELTVSRVIVVEEG